MDTRRARRSAVSGAPAARRANGKPGAPRSWTEAFHLSATLVGLGLFLVALGVAIDPRTSL